MDKILYYNSLLIRVEITEIFCVFFCTGLINPCLPQFLRVQALTTHHTAGQPIERQVLAQRTATLFGKQADREESDILKKCLA